MKIHQTVILKWCKYSFYILLLQTLFGWGIYGHEHINHAAVLALPAPLQIFFYNHIDYITEESTVPDLRKYTLGDKAEIPRHYVDLENFDTVDSLPSTLNEIKSKYDEKFLQENGILPWYIPELMEKLTKAFKDKRKTEILFLAADLGHYLGDAFMPLHTTVNHDGQLTNQKGIHSFWEAHLPELFGDNYNLKTRDAKYIDDVRKETWNIIKSSHAKIDTLLNADKVTHNNLPGDKIYAKDKEGNTIKNKFNQPVHSFEYAKQFHENMNGMVERQMRAAIAAAADFWFTAWVNAGKPDLGDLDSKELTQQNSKKLRMELQLWQKGKLFGMKNEKEY